MSDVQTIEIFVETKTVIRLPQDRFTKEQFFEFCMLNNDLRIERLANGKIIVMAPTSVSTGGKNADLTIELGIWNKTKNLGKVFDSSTGFTLPNDAVRSPDVSWIRWERLNALDKSEQNKFAAICPDFIIELRSASDNLSELREKMVEYMENGCRLAWLVDPSKRQTMVYQPDGSVQVIPFEQKLDGMDVLPGFELVMGTIITD